MRAGAWVVDMVHEEKLSAVLSEFARTLATDFPIQGILDHLVLRIVDVLPITAAGVTLISDGNAPHFVAASNENALTFERLQTDIGEGPCLAAYNTGEPVMLPDVRNDDRFPLFTAAAVAAGLVAVFTFPLRHGHGRLGALDLYRETPGKLAAPDMRAAQTLADVTTAYLLNAEARDVARAKTEAFRHSALHDSLTGLPNRELLQQRLEHAALRAQRSHANAAILFADLDRFKLVNDIHGHDVGDELLIAVTHRLSALVRPGDTLARFAGDEFVFLCEDLQSAADVEILARRVDDAFAKPFALGGGLELALTASVGVAFAGPGDEISGRLVANADMAMYQAKRRGGARHQILNLREAADTYSTNSLDRDLRAALADDSLHLAYQPIVRTSDGVMTGVEALLRWNHPLRGAVAPISMVAVAERSGLIMKLGAWVLERSCRDRSHWLREHPGVPLDLAVNVSGRQLMSQDFAATVDSVLSRTGMDPWALVLEITENVFIEESSRTMTALDRLKELGIRVALDDFGTGYSSLSYLRHLPIDIVKIDKSFVDDIGGDGTASAIVDAVTNLAHVLGLTVTAEGVETQRQHDQVVAIGCESAQGFFYAKPLPAAAVLERVAAG
jgi:diguanylate cyclase (GGDEF)-like protein